MALHLDGKLHGSFGMTTESYVRIEFYKVQPWNGTVEYNPAVYYNWGHADASRKTYFEDPIANNIPLRTLSGSVSQSIAGTGSDGSDIIDTFHSIHPAISFESGSFTGSLFIKDIYSFPLTESAALVTCSNWIEVETSESIDYVDFDEDGNEIVTTTWVSSSIWENSESIELRSAINLDNLSNIYQDCYTHLASQISLQIPSSSVKYI